MDHILSDRILVQGNKNQRPIELWATKNFKIVFYPQNRKLSNSAHVCFILFLGGPPTVFSNGGIFTDPQHEKEIRRYPNIGPLFFNGNQYRRWVTALGMDHTALQDPRAPQPSPTQKPNVQDCVSWCMHCCKLFSHHISQFSSHGGTQGATWFKKWQTRMPTWPTSPIDITYLATPDPLCSIDKKVGGTAVKRLGSGHSWSVPHWMLRITNSWADSLCAGGAF